jgi:archaeosine synthase
MIAGASLGPEAAKRLLDYQIEALGMAGEEIEPSRMILRIPSSLDLETAEGDLRRLCQKGLLAAAFRFDGSLGPTDFSTLLLRGCTPRNWLTLAVGRIYPWMVPMLYYLGFDVLDVGHAFEAAADGTRLWRMDSEAVGESTHLRFCSCPACASLSGSTIEVGSQLKEILSEHNLTIYQMLLSESVQAMKKGKMRWLVESMTHASPPMGGLLRRVDNELYAHLEEFTPTVGSKFIPLIGPESYNSPVVRRFRERVAARYIPPEHKRIVLLLPCSARKPYSDSKSHRRFSEVLESSLGGLRYSVAETILTSPLGLVPRELERMHPAAQYDIPVTGDWDAEETDIAVDALVSHLQKFDESAIVIAHVSGGYLDVVRSAEKEIGQSIVYTTPDHPATSKDSLAALRDTLHDMKNILNIEGRRRTDLWDTLRATSDYQFGRGSGIVLIPEEAKLRGKLYHMVTCKVDGEQTCAFVSEAGTLSLTLEGGRRLESLNRSWVKFEGREIKGGSIFAVGVREADPGIRPGDEVVVFDSDGRVAAVGRSEMSGFEMCDLAKGRAVTLRHKRGNGN